MENILKLSKLENERINYCPNCGAVIFKTHPKGWSRSEQQKYIFSNGGDTIGGVWDMLTNEQKRPNAFVYGFNLGDCTSCIEGFFAIEFNFIDHNEDSGVAIEKTVVGSYLLLNEKMDEPQNYIVYQSLYVDLPKSWVMSVFKTPYGNMYHHTIGLIDIDRLNEGCNITLRLFDYLKLIRTERL